MYNWKLKFKREANIFLLSDTIIYIPLEMKMKDTLSNGLKTWLTKQVTDNKHLRTLIDRLFQFRKNKLLKQGCLKMGIFSYLENWFIKHTKIYDILRSNLFQFISRSQTQWINNNMSNYIFFVWILHLKRLFEELLFCKLMV